MNLKSAKKRPNEKRRLSTGGFTLAELVVVLALSAVVVGMAVISYRAVTQSAVSLSTQGDVTIGAEANEVLYGDTDTDVAVYYAPNYGRMTQADRMKARFYEDVSQASAVFVLARDGLNWDGTNPIRPSTITNVSGNPPIDTAYKFIAALENTQAGASAVYTDWLSGVSISGITSDADKYRGALSGDNVSVFIIEPGGTEGVFAVKAIWEVDLIETNSPEGTYASVRRYESTSLTDYYDIFYEGSSGGAAFNPLAVAYERGERTLAGQASSLNNITIAENMPYYYLFWPDPSFSLIDDAPAATYTESSPQFYISDMGNRTQYFFVVPMYPSLQ